MTLADNRRANFKAWMEASDLTLYRVSKDTGVNYNTLRSYVGDGTDKITESLKGSNEAQIANTYRLTIEDIFGSEEDEEGPRNHLRAWREFRFLTVDELAAAIGSTAATVEMLEAQPNPPSGKWLRRFAPAFETTVGMILDFAPQDVDPEMLNGAFGLRSQKPNPAPVQAGRRRTGTEG